MRHKLALLLVVLSLFAACAKHEKARAVIFERKELKNDRLTIKYKYSVAGELFTDSAVVKNNIIKSDSIDVIINPSDPSKGLPDLDN